MLQVGGLEGGSVVGSGEGWDIVVPVGTDKWADGIVDEVPNGALGDMVGAVFGDIALLVG